MKELTELETMNVEFLSDKEIPFTTVLLTENIWKSQIQKKSLNFIRWARMKNAGL